MHGDGSAGDGVYGITIPVQSLRIQYYIYADNSTAGIFSPERAEHEFHEIKANIQMATSLDIVLNEVVTNNNSVITNEQGKTKDYIEVVNITSVPLVLNTLCLSDDSSDPTKWQFPGSVFILPGQHLLVWSDDNDNVYLDPHTNFNLTSTGEFISLSDTLGNVFQTTNSPFQNADEAWGRCYDALGDFNLNSNATPRNTNDCIIAIDEVSVQNFSVYPVPALNSVTVEASDEIGKIELFDFTGKLILTEYSFGSKCVISINHLNAGIYAIRRNNGHLILIEKL
jgi:hypothetical protein